MHQSSFHSFLSFYTLLISHGGGHLSTDPTGRKAVYFQISRRGHHLLRSRGQDASIGSLRGLLAAGDCAEHTATGVRHSHARRRSGGRHGRWKCIEERLAGYGTAPWSWQQSEPDEEVLAQMLHTQQPKQGWSSHGPRPSAPRSKVRACCGLPIDLHCSTKSVIEFVHRVNIS